MAKIRFRVCKLKGCGEKYEVNPLRPLFPCCSINHAYEYQNYLKSQKKAKEDRDYIAKHKPETHKKEYAEKLQDNVNLLSRMIDVKFGLDTCIDCKGYLDKEKHQIDACHFHSRKKNGTLRHNLHNLHSGHNFCNVWNKSHEENYKAGLEQRYGVEYMDYVVNQLPLIYKEVHLSSVEVIEKLKIVRAIIRNFNTYKFESSYNARCVLNKIIGIYK
jgi:hypothetical protein